MISNVFQWFLVRKTENKYMINNISIRKKNCIFHTILIYFITIGEIIAEKYFDHGFDDIALNIYNMFINNNCLDGLNV